MPGGSANCSNQNASSQLTLDENQELAHLRSLRCSRLKTSSSLDGPGTLPSFLDEGGFSSPRDARKSSASRTFKTRPSSAFARHIDEARIFVQDVLCRQRQLRLIAALTQSLGEVDVNAGTSAPVCDRWKSSKTKPPSIRSERLGKRVRNAFHARRKNVHREHRCEVDGCRDHKERGI